jgi:hypothetical protein
MLPPGWITASRAAFAYSWMHARTDPTDIIIECWSGPWRAMLNPCTDGSNYIYFGSPVGDPRGRRRPVVAEVAEISRHDRG